MALMRSVRDGGRVIISMEELKQKAGGGSEGFDSALKMLSRQGEMVYSGGIACFDPSWLAQVLEGLITVGATDKPKVASYVQASAGANADRRATQSLTAALDAIETVGELREELLPFCWRSLTPVPTEADRKAILQALTESGLLVPFVQAGEKAPAYGARRWLMPLRLPQAPPERLTKLWPLTPSGAAFKVDSAEGSGAHTSILRESSERLLSAKLSCHGSGALPGHVIDRILVACAPLGQTVACWRSGMLISAGSGGSALIRAAGWKEREKEVVESVEGASSEEQAQFLTDSSSGVEAAPSSSPGGEYSALLVEVRGTAELSALWTLLRSLVDALHTALAALRGLQYSIDLACPRCLGEEKKAIGWFHPIHEPSLYDLDQLLEDGATHRYCQKTAVDVELLPKDAKQLKLLEKLAAGQEVMLKGQGDLQAEARKMSLAVEEVRLDVKEVKATVKRMDQMLRSQNEMLGTLLRGEYDCPSYFVMAPPDLRKVSKASQFFRWTNPTMWVGKPIDLRFVCAVTMQPVGEDYRITMPRDWVVKYGPALATSLRVLAMTAAVAKIAFVLCPDLSGMAEGAAQAVTHQLVPIAAIQDGLREGMQQEGMGGIEEWLSQMSGQMDDLQETIETQAFLSALRHVAGDVAGGLDELSSNQLRPSEVQGASGGAEGPPEEQVKQSYGYVRRTIMEQDERFERSGLVRAVANKPCSSAWAERYKKAGLTLPSGHAMGDGSVAWVAREWQAHYERVGRPLLGLKPEQADALREGAGIKSGKSADPDVTIKVDEVKKGGCCVVA